MAVEQIYPKNYVSLLNMKETENAIKQIKDFFQLNLATELRLRRVTAPLFVKKGTGINDDLNGIEKAVSFKVQDVNNIEVEIVHSLAKWKRLMLGELDIKPNYGLYTDMNAIRADEILDNIHSLYVDQWDWEKVITPEERNLDYFKKNVRQIYSTFRRTEFHVHEFYPQIVPTLPEEITFIHSEELLEMYPDKEPYEREVEICQKYGAVFLIGIGGKLKNNKVHDGRAPDYDDWTTTTINGYKGLNGDILVWNNVLNRSFELSSMGIRIDREAMLKQLAITNTENRKELFFHKKLLNDELPLSIGGGIGQSRLCMFLLKKAHIGETQVSIWSEEMIKTCKLHGITLF